MEPRRVSHGTESANVNNSGLDCAVHVVAAPFEKPAVCDLAGLRRLTAFGLYDLSDKITEGLTSVAPIFAVY